MGLIQESGLSTRYPQMMLLIMFLSVTSAAKLTQGSDTVYLAAGTSMDVTGNNYGRNALRVYCYKGKSHSVVNLFETVEFRLDIGNEDFSEYWGRTPEEVQEAYNEKQSLFSFTLFSQKRQRIQLSPFEQQCIGVESSQPYNVSLSHMQLDLSRLLQLATGLFIIWFAGKLAKNSVFYYLAGMVLGISASLLVVIAVVSKLFPRRPMVVGVLVGGWTIGLYVLRQLITNIRVILISYRDYVLWYLLITGLVSFLVCYRIGPPNNPRSQNIIMWVLQAIGSVFVYFCSWHTSACIALLLIIFVARYIPHSVVNYLCTFYRHRFPPKRRLLTIEEYYQQSVNETARSLAELREYVNSPGCRQWNIMAALQNPMRFATFANGAPHLFDEEIEDYSRTIEESMEGADENEVEDFLQCSMYYRPTNRRNTQRPAAPIRPNYHPTYQAPQLRHQNNNHNRENYDDNDDDNDDYMDQD